MKTTSIEANDTKDKEKDYTLIFWALSKSRKPKTYRQISQMLKWEPMRSARRMAELVRLDKVEVCDAVTCPIGGKKCKTYKNLDIEN